MPKSTYSFYLLVSSLIFTATGSYADPIHEAAIDGDVEQVKQLLISGVDANAKDPDGTPLQWALFTNQTQVIGVLLEHGADPNISGSSAPPLETAAVSGNAEIVKLLLKHRADPNSRTDSTPIIRAAQSGSLEIVELLLAAGADPLTTSTDGSSALHEAAKKGELEMAQKLVAVGMDVNALNGVNWPPIHLAARYKHAALVDYFREQGAVPGEILPINDLISSADLVQGQTESEKQCDGCHVGEKYGPPLGGVVGRAKSSDSNYSYSLAFKSLEGQWTIEELNKFLARPTEIVPGTKMEIRGIEDPQTRANIVVYLKTLTD